MRGALALALALTVAAGGSAGAQRLSDPVLPMLTGVDPERLLLVDRKDVRGRKANPPDPLQLESIARIKSMAALHRLERQKRNAAAGAWLWFFIAVGGNAAMCALLMARQRRTGAVD